MKNKDITICTLEEAKKNFKSILENKKIEISDKENTKGVFIYLSSNKDYASPIQICDNSEENFQEENYRCVVIVGENSRLKIIHAEENQKQNISLENNIEVFLEDNSSLEYYKVENIFSDTMLKSNANFNLGNNTQLKTFWLSINGKAIRNKLNVEFNGEYSSAQLNGLYLGDNQQTIDNQISVFHNKPHCTSNQLYKGILDDSAKALFQGHIYVEEGASFCEAMQKNKNILLSDKASVNTQPFLEIYNDEVKCSHGATIGQLDENAMFYMQSRGITKRSARMLLLFAFCTEVLSSSSIEELNQKLEDIIKRRLHGDISDCQNCILLCNTPCLTFNIDKSKIENNQ
ncbi:MAG: Fe-S cluster assembly protein SufD [Bacteroidales bacterium]|jgi:Fe-S cluster assembly protein SufD|nr:Fe-S cluster assembly protein SufD [Bacteroidales bacterium]